MANDCVSKIMISPDSLAIIKYDMMLDVLEFRRIVSIATIVGNRSKSLSAFLAMKSYPRDELNNLFSFKSHLALMIYHKLPKFSYFKLVCVPVARLQVEKAASVTS